MGGAHYDVIVDGAGASGSVVAARLARAGRRVLVLEAGAVPRSIREVLPATLDAGTVIGAMPNPELNWAFPAELTPGQPYEIVRGRGLGGSSAINGAYFIRPRLADFAAWAAVGGAEWSYEAALPRMRAIECDLDYGESELHGGHGPIAVSRAPLTHQAAAALADAAGALGIAAEADKNAQGEPGVGPVPVNSRDGVRQSAGLGYLLPLLGRSDAGATLEVRGGATVTGVRFAGERAVGVDYVLDGVACVAEADEIVLAAGALKTAQLLLLSGIGPEAELRRAGVPLRVRAESVGTRLSEHPQVLVDWMPRALPAAALGGWLGAAVHAGDTEILQSLVPMSALLGAGPRAPGRDAGGALSLFVATVAAESTGRLRLRLRSPGVADPTDPPTIELGFLASDAARARLRDGTRLAWELLHNGGLAELSEGAIDLDAATVADDAALDAWVRAHLGTAQHACSTAPFGVPGAAVDGAGRVLGVPGLRVADLSILPAAPHRGPALAALLVAETVAASLLA